MAPLDSDYAKGTSETDLYDDDFTVQEAILSSLNDVISALEVEESYLDDKRRPSVTICRDGNAVGNSSSSKDIQRLGDDSGTGVFAKVWIYANSRLPSNLPLLQVYLPTWPLVCLAAQYSERVYRRVTEPGENQSQVEGDKRQGTKAMVLKSVALDDKNTVVMAIRGSQTFRDWAINFQEVPVSPVGFLDDAGNLCHSGFLSVARAMIEPIATRLRSLLQENPGRSGTSSLVMTGHSAGGAVAALLYAHMMSVEVHSELTALVPFLKRIHCITFGAPPVTLLPLMAERQGHAPDRAENEREEHGRRNRKSLFFSFINEGDPVARADKTVVASLLKLHALPAPVVSKAKPLAAMAGRKKQAPNWMVPPGTLSNAGRLVLLRLPLLKEARESSVEACLVTDDQLRTVIFGDPSLHSMKLYARRIETLATRAVTGRAGAAS